MGSDAHGRPNGGVREPDRSPIRRLSVQGAWGAQRHFYRPGLHLGARSDPRRGRDLQAGWWQGGEDHLEPDRHQGLWPHRRVHRARVRRRGRGRGRCGPRPAVRSLVRLRHGQEVQDLRRLLDASGRAAADGRPRHRHDRQFAALCGRPRHAGEQGVCRRLRQQVQAAAVLVLRVGVHGELVDADGDRADQGECRGPGSVPCCDAPDKKRPFVSIQRARRRQSQRCSASRYRMLPRTCSRGCISRSRGRSSRCRP